MVNKYYIFLFVFLSACGGGSSSEAPVIESPVWIASGQSNMAMMLDGHLAGPGEMPALPGYFIDYMHQSGQSVTVIPTAIGATSLECWQMGGPCFETKIRPLKGKVLAGVLWWQGEAEAEACDGTADTYGTRLQHLIESWRVFFNSPGLPFYVVQLGTLPTSADIDPAVECGQGPGFWLNKWNAVKSGQATVAHVTTSDITYGDTIHPIYAYSEIARRVVSQL